MLSTNISADYATNLDTKYDIFAIVVLIISIVGVIVNSMTLIAFQYSRMKKKYRVHKTWNHITVFIWNLALVDMLSALNMTVLYTIFVFYPNAINSYPICILTLITRDILVLISAAAIASIAFVTVLGITKNDWLKDYCDSSIKVTLFIIITWFVGFVGYAGKLFRIYYIFEDYYGSIKAFDCGTFFHKVNLSQVTVYSEFMVHFTVLVVLFTSYGVITTYTTCINQKVTGHREGNHPRCSPTTKVVLTICCTYVLQIIPYMICHVFFKETMRIGFFIQFAWPQKLCYIIYYTQFFPNIIIYVTRNKIYRDVYVYWLQSSTRSCSTKRRRTHCIERRDGIDLCLH